MRRPGTIKSTASAGESVMRPEPTSSGAKTHCFSGTGSLAKRQSRIARVVAGQFEIEPIVGQHRHLADHDRGVALLEDQ